jgi:phospholipase C
VIGAARGRLAAALIGAGLLLVAPAGGAAAAAGRRGASGPGMAGACRGGAAPQRWRHVIWIWMENHSYASVLGSAAPFTSALARACGLATGYHNVTHPSLPNYLAATSGSTQGVTDDCSPADCSRASDSIFQQVSRSGRSWAAYDESMPSNCALGSDGLYAARHNPAVYYTAIRRECARSDVPLGTPAAGPLAAALRANRLPAFAFVTPNLCDDTHDCSVATGDAWLARWLPAIVGSRAYRAGGTAVVVTWDEGEGGSTNDCARNTSDPGCHVAAIVVSPSTRPGTRARGLFDHYSLLRLTEGMLGLPYLGHAGDAALGGMRRAFHL